MMEDKNVTINVSGGQFSYARDQATINAIQNNGVSADELNKIVQGIINHLSDLEKEDAESIRDIVDMANAELTSPQPKVSRLRNCLSLLSPMLTVANGIPVLADNLQKLMDYITPFIG